MRSLPELERVIGAKSPGDLRSSDAREALRRMIRLMPADQRRLIEMVIINRQSHRAAAAALHMVPGVVTRRVRRLRNRLACPVRRALAAHVDTLPAPTRGLAVDHFFAGVPRTRLARTFNLSLRDVQAQLDYVQGWIRALNRRRLTERRMLEAQLEARDQPSDSVDD